MPVYGFEEGKNKIPAQDKHLQRTITLAANGWGSMTETGGDSYYYQIVNVDGVTLTNTVIAGPKVGQGSTANIEAYIVSGIYARTQGDGNIKFACLNKLPQIDIDVDIIILEV